MATAHDPDMPTGALRQISPRVGRVLAPNPSHFTYTGTQTYLVGTTDLAVIDPGPDDAEHIAALLSAIDGRPVRAILCTHTHQPDRILGDGEQVAGEGWTLEAVATPGHTSNHLCFALVEEGALLTGDHVMGWSTSVISPPDGDMADYMRSMQRLLDREDAVYYPAHGDAVDNPRRLVRGMMGHRKQREGQIVRFLERNGASHIPDMVAEMYKGVDPRLHPAAGRSVLAHLIDLDGRGIAAAIGDGRWQLR
jgi:glyoxylase-like metal-dependent hydrolase (beta-lactamase superfamily II)